MKPLFLQNASELITLKGFSNDPLVKPVESDLSIIQNGSVLIDNGTILAVGQTSELKEMYPEKTSEADVIDASGSLVTPGFVEPHTHLVFAGSREQEFAMRLKGASYMDIMNAGGGIYATTEQTKLASHQLLYTQSYERLDRLMKQGVTTVEAKSGYGLDLKNEKKQLEVARELNQKHAIDLVSTFMGAHAVPPSYKQDPDEFIAYLINDVLPVIAKEGLAEFNDVFCEKGVFTVEQSRRVLEAGERLGLSSKIHADELESYGGAELAAELEAVSADHLLCVSDKGIDQMAAAGVVAVLLPGTAFFLQKKMANARKMIDRGVPVALSTDCNPGSSPTVSTALMMNFGCLQMGMTPAEVLVAVTINAAHAINRGSLIGSIEVGKKADLLLFSVPTHHHLHYHFGENHVKSVIKNGIVRVQEGMLI
ncbi:imidazolonepropionase [Guptibacillus hwajinpoensis]|uniref:Imidazolonepropionase n=1 Tax=Guptibacillus hwajinpoensis TaxID=208199 RepID=A0ABU0JZY1_9BACL|nr:imidazolonepropionase [Alkalihalobacillus hemicentroti]MDQ0482668.1 imidazolonepropionase [Alkalihalobacillus hemicentroti]